MALNWRTAKKDRGYQREAAEWTAQRPWILSTRPSTGMSSNLLRMIREVVGMEEAAYSALREKYRPDKLKLLFIAESPAQSRSFYDVGTSDNDWLYLETMGVLFHNLVGGLYGEGSSHSRAILRVKKDEYLQCFRNEGFWLLDAVPTPFAEGMNTRDKAEAIRRYAPRLMEIINACRPDGCVLIGRTVYDNLADELRRAGAPVLNQEFIPFPAYGHSQAFRQKLGGLLLRHGILPLRSC